MNDNKSTVINNAAVQQLRKVPGFDPMKLLRIPALVMHNYDIMLDWLAGLYEIGRGPV